MEARQTLRGSAVPKSLMVVLAICAAAALAIAGAVITKDLAGSNSTTVKSTVQAAPGTVLRQDNPVQPALSSAPAEKHNGRSSGNQSIEGSDGVGLTAGNPGWDARSVREGHGA
ncbi:MAG TPA: hypothetical protein VGK28_04650 [Candidatus Dormibacteraeota bacterium]|jgi:hypothetical protein